MKAATSGKGPPRCVMSWSNRVQNLAEQVDVSCTSKIHTPGGRPASAILRLRARDAEGVSVGGTAVLTLYKTGSWTWGGDADVVAYAREPLERHGVVPSC